MKRVTPGQRLLIKAYLQMLLKESTQPKSCLR
jgi:hypothetical protein